MSSPESVAQRVALLGIVVSVILATIKISIGLAARSVAVVSDGFESAADVLASGLALFGLKLAGKPPDEDHPYGHGRFETLSGLAIGVLLVAVGTGICIRSLEQRNDTHVPALFAIWPLLGSIAAKVVLGTAKFRYGRRTRSSGLIADAWNDMVDILSGIVALIGVGLSIFVPQRMAAADHYSGSLIGFIVCFLGLRVIYETVMHLTDTMPGASQMAEIRAVALRVEGARGVEKCFARKTGLRYHVDLHLEVDPDLSVRASHEIAGAVKRTIKKDLDWVDNVLVHVEPYLQPREDHRAPSTIKR